MNIHEYQAKALLKSFGVSVSDGVPIMKADEAEAAAKSLPGPVWVVKSQIHAGGRGKGRFKELGADAAGGVRVVKSIEDVVKNAGEMLGNTLVTKQTGPAGISKPSPRKPLKRSSMLPLIRSPASPMQMLTGCATD